MKTALLVLMLALGAVCAEAQTVRGDRFTFNLGGETLRNGAGSPEGVVAAPVGDIYFDNLTGHIYRKELGTGSTGWVLSTLPAGGQLGQLLRNMGPGAVPAWTLPTYPNTAAFGSFIRGDGTNWLASTLTIPNTLDVMRVPFAIGQNTIGSDADFTFLVDTLTATKTVAPHSVTTPNVYSYGATPSPLRLGGTGIGCANVTQAECEQLELYVQSPFSEQRLSSDTNYRSQWYVSTESAHLNAYNSTGWLPLTLSGAPARIAGGGFQVGGTTVIDPGLGNSVFDGYLSSTLYASQLSGWRITPDGAGDFRYMFLDEVHAKKFVADQEIALMGGVLITKSQGRVGAPFAIPAKGNINTLIVKDIPDTPNMPLFEVGDTIAMRQFSRAEGGLSTANAYGAVTGYVDLDDGTQSWSFQRYPGTAGGTMPDGVTLPVDALVLDMGVSGAGYYEINAADGRYAENSPYAQTVRWTGAAPVGTNLQVTSRMGQLKGITGTSEYGLLFGKYGVGSEGQYGIFSDLKAELHNIPFSLWSGVNQTLYMNPTLSSFQQATNNASALTYSTGTGCWSGIDAGTFKWRCGDMAGNNISWNGVSLNVVGNITVSGFVADDTRAVGGVPAAEVSSGAGRALIGLGATGNPVLPSVATPTGNGLFLGSDYMGYFASGAWRTYMTSNGSFYLGGTGGALQFNGATGALTISGTVNILSGSVPSSSVTGLGALALLNTAALGTNTTGNYAGSNAVGGNANNTNAVGNQTQAQVQQATVSANIALATNGRFLNPVPAAPTGNGLFLGSDYMGYYGSGTWQSYMDSFGNFYLGGTGGALRWNAGAGTLYINGNGVFSGTLQAASGTFVGTVSAGGGAVTLDANGIVITTPPLYQPTHAYNFTNQWAGGRTGTFARLQDDGARYLGIINASDTAGVSNLQIESSGFHSDGTRVFASLNLEVDPSNKVGRFRMVSTSDLFIQAPGGINYVGVFNSSLVTIANVGLLGGGGILVEARTASTGTPVVHAANGYYYDQSSSERVKYIWERGWKPDPKTRQAFLDMPSLLFSYIGDPEEPVIGFSAEMWEASPLPYMVNYDQQGRPQSYRTDAFLVYTHDIQQNHEARIAALEKELAMLRGKQ